MTSNWPEPLIEYVQKDLSIKTCNVQKPFNYSKLPKNWLISRRYKLFTEIPSEVFFKYFAKMLRYTFEWLSQCKPKSW